MLFSFQRRKTVVSCRRMGGGTCHPFQQHKTTPSTNVNLVCAVPGVLCRRWGEGLASPSSPATQIDSFALCLWGVCFCHTADMSAV